jgi:hypothetical protein
MTVVWGSAAWRAVSPQWRRRETVANPARSGQDANAWN